MAYLTNLPKELHSALRAGICTPFRPFRSIAAGWPPVWVQFNQNDHYCKGIRGRKSILNSSSLQNGGGFRFRLRQNQDDTIN
jgi:hypothetical protein